MRRAGSRSLTEHQIRQIRDLYGINGGIIGLVTIRQLADYYHVSHTTIWHILHLPIDLRQYAA